ncbi:hypothetical protein HZA97_08080 [Candidatus Woesearchaeota archaeon]|nr:hypothetical protein [Candidatus Woesearchaeota archaeon]
MNTSIQNKVTVELKKEDVKDNLLKILDDMSKLRNECVVNLESTNQQKTDYLKLTSELASCVEALIEENNLEEQVNKIISFVKSDELLKCYDILQNKFWTETNPQFLNSLSNLSVYLLGDDFSSTTHSYHLFQALKYLKLDENKIDVIKTILPINSLLNNSSTLSKILVEKFVGKKIGDYGIATETAEKFTLINELEKLGVLYAEVPLSIYESASLSKYVQGKKVIKRSQKAIISFAKEEEQNAKNTFKEFQNYAKLNLGKIEDNLVLKVSNFYNFGEEFLEELKNKINPERKEQNEPKESLEDIIYVEENNADNGSSKLQGDWIKYGKKHQKVIASASDLYKTFKQIKRDLESDNETRKRNAERLKQEYKHDFIAALITSTRITNSASSITVKDHHDCFNPELIKEKNANLSNNQYCRHAFSQINEASSIHNFLSALFDTNDSVKEISETLSKLVDCQAESMMLHKSGYDSYARERVVRLISSNNQSTFFIECENSPGNASGRARLLQTTKPISEEQGAIAVPDSVIDKENSCVYFLNAQKINNHTKLTGLFCYNKERYVVSIIQNTANFVGKETNLVKILSQETTSEEKIKQIEETLSPIYSHLVKYELKGDDYKEIDDVEVFRK